MFGFGQVYAFYMRQVMWFRFPLIAGGFIQDGGNLGDHIVTQFFMEDAHITVYIITERQHIELLSLEKYMHQEEANQP